MQAVQRIRFFDMAKGVGILCVVLGHAAIESIFVEPSNTAQWAMATCFSFHMPLFFLVAGYFMHPERDFQWRKEGKQLVLTYAITACLVVAGGRCNGQTAAPQRARYGALLGRCRVVRLR